MSSLLSSDPKGVFDTRSSPGVGEESKTLGRVMSELQQQLLKSFSIGKPKRDALGSLDETFEECCQPGWDGYEATRASFESYLKAKRFIQQYPTSLPVPEVSIDPDGEISFEWFVAPNRVFSVSIGSDDELTYAGIFGASKTHGTEAFTDEIPKAILDNIRRLGR